MRKFLFIVLRIVVGVYLGLSVMLFFFQRSMIYYPQPRSNTDDITVEALQVDGQRVLVSTRPHAGEKALIYFGGNAEDVSLGMPGLAAAFPDAAIYLLHYPGYGGSSGKPTEKSIVASAFALFDLVHARHASVVLIGRSLGTGAAVQVAAARPVSRLVLVTPYDSLSDAAAREYPFLPVNWLMRDKYESWRYAPRITAPTLILAAGQDELIPRSSTERLRGRFREGVVHYVVVPDAGHNSISDSPKYLELLKAG
ncbi:MAG: alpha/beta hydrolase [Terracidiphilus sp.]